MMILFIGTTEIVFIFLIVLLLFGAKKIPEIARSLGKGVRDFQKATEEIKREISDVKNATADDSHKESDATKGAKPLDKDD